MTPRSPRIRAALGLTGVALLALTACGARDDAAQPAPSSASDSAQLPTMDMAPFTVDVPALGLEHVPEASLAVIDGEDPRYHAAWLQVPGAPVWTDAMSAAVRGHVDAYVRDTDRSADPVLDSQPRLAVSGRDVAAARLLSTERRGSQSSSTVQVVWYDARQDRVLATSDLFTDDGWAAFRDEVGQRMSNDPAVVRDRVTSAVQQHERPENSRIWDAVVFLPDGSALLEVDQAALAPNDAGVLTTRIPAETVRPWLSETGRTAQDAARTPQHLVLPQRDAASSSAAGAAAPAPAPGRASSGGTATTPGASTAPGAPAPVPGASTPGSAPGGTPTTPGGAVGSAPADAPAPGTAPAPSTGVASPGTTSPAQPRPGTTAPRPGTTAPRPGTTAPAPGTTAPAPGTTTPAPGTTTPAAPGTTAPADTPAPAPSAPSSSDPVPADPAPSVTESSVEAAAATTSPQGRSAPGNSGDAPGQGGSAPGNSGDAPGQTARSAG